MPVRTEDAMWPFDDFEGISTDDLLTTTFPSEDIWKKFDFCDSLSDLPMPLYDDLDLDLDAVLEWSLDASAVNEIRHHDCMWAGHCGSKEHKSESIKVSRPLLQVSCPVPKRAVVPPTPAPVNATSVINAGRSLLLSSQVNSRNVTASTVLKTVMPIAGRPDSPPSSDDDDHPRFKHETVLFENAIAAVSNDNKMLQLLNDAISECDFDEDSDLCEYFEDSDVFAESELGSRETSPRDVYSCESDHSYHKGKDSTLRIDHLGVQTPSDSEEEIDVVTIGDKQLLTNRNCTVLPTNPTIRDRQKLQRTVASAISNNKREFIAPTTIQTTGTGIKTRLPVRLSPTTTTSATLPTTPNNASAKKRGAGSAASGDGRRGVKRGRYRLNKGGSPAKRRGNHSSDSETECSEKRSLHNNMERQRRVDLRNAFDDLRVLVPEVSAKERAAKVVILREAAAYCDKLGEENLAQQRQVAELRRIQDKLRARVSQLRRSLAAKR